MTDANESRLTALTRIEVELKQIRASQERLDKWLRTAILDYRQMGQEDRDAARSQFREATGSNRAAGGRGSVTRAALAAGHIGEGYGEAENVSPLSRYFDESFFRG